VVSRAAPAGPWKATSPTRSAARALVGASTSSTTRSTVRRTLEHYIPRVRSWGVTATLGRYEILAPLARGGMAEVFLARRRSGAGIEKRLVIKRIRSEHAADPGMMALFVREARVSMALSHQNIVPVFDFGRVDDALFLAMDYVDGRDLGAVLTRTRDRGERMDPMLIAAIGAECCAALAYAHARRFDELIGVVHRDVTPRNILLSWSGEVRLTDFGVAVLRHDDTGAVRGTPSYMAPEQARGEDVDGRADLYALGLTLWEAATGARVRAVEPHAALAQARRGNLPAVPSTIAPELAAVIARATAANAAERYPDARAMQDALDRAALAARAGRPGAPSRLLADWLESIYGDEAQREALDERPAPMDAVTFLDDGEAAVLGAATAASMAGTRAETEPPVPARRPRPSSGRRLVILGALVGLLAVGGAAIVWRATRTPSDTLAVAPADARRPEPRRPDAAVVAPPPIDAGPPDAASIDATPATLALPIDAGPRRPAADAAAPAPDAAVATRKVTIGSRPWSKFYVDGGATGHETPETIDLAPGPHRIRFVNETARVDRTITLDVPADRDLKHVEVLVPETP